MLCFLPLPSSSTDGEATSLYDTRLGVVSLTWSRTLLGLSLLIDLPFSSTSLRVRPWTLTRRKGSERAHLPTGVRHVAVEVTWDLTRAKFSSPAGPDPVAGFFVAVSVDGDLLLHAGDLKKESSASPISRKERTKLRRKGGRTTYTTSAAFEGRRRKISIELEEREKELGMVVRLEGKRVLEVTRLEWKFRGSERVVLEGGDRIQISWDFCNWFSLVKGEVDAVFVFRFERAEEEEEEKEGLSAHSGRSWNWSESSFGSESAGLSSTSASAGGSSVMDWESLEEAHMRKSDGFSLVVFGFKS